MCKEIESDSINEEKEHDNEWNIVDTQPGCNETTDIPMSNFTQSIIIGSLNNRLSGLSEKMDLIINKLDNLDKRLDNLEIEVQKNNLNKSEYDQDIYNNPDIDKILKLNESELESLKERRAISTSTKNVINTSTTPISISPRSNFHSPLTPTFYDNNFNTNGLKYLSNVYNNRMSKPGFIPFSSPY